MLNVAKPLRTENAQFALFGRLDAAAVGILLFKRSKNP